MLGLGLLALVGYMIWQRWTWHCYVLPSEIAQPTVQPDGPASDGFSG